MATTDQLRKAQRKAERLRPGKPAVADEETLQLVRERMEQWEHRLDQRGENKCRLKKN